MPHTGYVAKSCQDAKSLSKRIISGIKYYEEGQIISNYNLQKMRELSQQTEQGDANYRNICKKSNILFFIAIKSCKHTNKCILIRVKLLVNEFALGFCIFSVKIYKCFY